MSFIITEIVKGLSYLHSLGISHRDIKTENILIGLNANHLKVKIIDFGFATRMEKADAHCGTPNYMAP
jgi:p21-activated kinase 1